LRGPWNKWAAHFLAASKLSPQVVFFLCGAVQGVYYGLLARLVLVLGLRRCVCSSSARKLLGRRLGLDPCLGKFRLFRIVLHCLVQSVAIFMGVFAGLCQREHFIEPWVHHHNDTYTYDLVSPEVADFAGTVATSLFDCTTGIISAVITMAMSLLCILWTWECMLLPLVVFGCYLVVTPGA